MSLDSRQLERVRDEFEAALDRSGITTDDLAQGLGWDLSRLERALAVDPRSDAVDLWAVRDHLHVTLKRSGMSSPFTVLSSANRLRARLWFGLPAMPRR